jgi:acyl-[acyl-carrier-protein]-phospholipid O-acyltransferase/long-chain-fatty-acid--[acyl-carrier-protein] ligase
MVRQETIENSVATFTHTTSSVSTESKSSGLGYSFIIRLVQGCFRMILKSYYRVNAMGWERMPREGGVLLVGNHLSYTDAIIIAAMSPRPVRMMGAKKLIKHGWMRLVFRLFRVIPVDRERPLEVIRAATTALRGGEVVVVFPEGTISGSGELLPFQKGCLIIARQAGCPLLSFALKYDLKASFSSILRPLTRRLPKLRSPRHVQLQIGSLLHPATSTMSDVRAAVVDAQAQAFEAHPDLQKSLAELALRGLKRNFFTSQFVDLTADRRELRSGMLLALALTLADRWRGRLEGERRIGVVLPSGLGSTLTNLALQILGKTPVNLNFTAGAAVNEKCLRKASIETVITATPALKKLPDFPWPERTVDLIKERGALRKIDVVKNLLRAWILSPTSLISSFENGIEGGEREATILFSSGTTGDPKGVVLSQRNIVANLLQIDAVQLLGRKETLLACLPTFHSFGFTVTQWFPLYSGMRVVSLPSPLETKRLGHAIAEENVTVLMSTPTFLKPFIKRVSPEAMRSLKYVIAGAERSPEGLAASWEERFGSTYLEGYGLTEASPVVSCNLPAKDGGAPVRRLGTLGQPFVAQQLRIVDEQTGEVLKRGERGMLELRGPNLFRGYLNDEGATQRAFRDGWYVTGDLARLDADGFLIIEGRLSRFSKLGGEMVPHGAIEEAVARAFDLDGDGAHQVAVTGVQDAQKGEALVLLSVVDFSLSELRERLTAEGLPNLWIPKRVCSVSEIPTLGSGKMDLRAINELARQALAG